MTTHTETFIAARAASREVAIAPASRRRAWLQRVAEGLGAREAEILAANDRDLVAYDVAGTDAARRDRMRLDGQRLAAMAAAVREIAAQEDPLAAREEMGDRPSGITISRIRSPLGLIGMIYEARPNVTIDAAALALYAGNAIVLRPGREIRHTAKALGDLLGDALEVEGLPREALTVLDDPDRSWFQSMLKASGIIDLLIPRGGEALIRAVEAEARVPVLAHATGVCHVFVHRTADLDKARRIVLNGKTQRPGVCNATEGLLLDRVGLDASLPLLVGALVEAGVKVHGSVELAALDARITPDGDAYRGHEWLSLDITLQAVDGLEAAIAYIQEHGSGHTEAIVSEDPATVEAFVRRVQASAVMANASTRFNDGGELGLGAEIGISTSRLHAWGPMGAEALTARRWVVVGDGATRA